MDVVIVIPYAKENVLYKDSFPQDIKIIEVKMDRTDTGIFSNLVYFRQLKKIYVKEKPDIIFHYTIKPNIFGGIAAKLTGIPCISMVAGLGAAFSSNSLGHILIRILYRVGLSCANKVIVLNQGNYDTILKGNFCKEERLIFFEGGEGVNLCDFNTTINDSENTIFLLVCRIIKDKGYYEFVEAAKQIKREFNNVEFELVGSLDLNHENGVPESQIKKDICSGAIKYLGTTTNMTEIYDRPGVVVTVPSFYNEGLNRTLMEGCACGKPIITTDLPGCKETVIDGVNGFLCQPKDTLSLVKAMRRYLALGADEKNKMARASRILAESKFDVNIVIKKYETILSEYL